MKPNTHNITSVNVNGNVFSNGQVIAETFIKYFVTVAQNMHVNNYNANASSQHENPISYLCRAFNQPFPPINFKYVSFKEIEEQESHLKQKTHMGMMRYQQKLWNWVFNTFLLPYGTYATEYYLLAFFQHD